MDTHTDEELADRPQVACHIEEGEGSDQDQDTTTADLDQALSEEQTYRETMRSFRSFMGWKNSPDIDISASTADDNSFAGSKIQPVGKVSVNMPMDDWLCKKMNKRRLTPLDGYLRPVACFKDQLIEPARSQAQWCMVYTLTKGRRPL